MNGNYFPLFLISYLNSGTARENSPYFVYLNGIDLAAYAFTRQVWLWRKMITFFCMINMNDLTTHSLEYKRRHFDRRKAKVSIFCRHWLTGRRKAVRRVADRQKSYQIDTYGPKTLVVILVIITLSILDALFTLFLISHGATEVNPIMDYFLDRGPSVFFVAKYMLTAVCLILILAIRNFYLFNTKARVKILYIFFMISFVLVVEWELYLILFAI